MIKITQSNVFNFENAIRGARNPMNSWDRSDSRYENHVYVLGDNDLKLARNLCKAGSDHRKFTRQIIVSVDICAPLYWWKEFDTYKVGTVTNSTSTMHKIHSKEFNISDFSADILTDESKNIMNIIIEHLEQLRLKFISTKDKRYWYDMIQLLPESYNQLRTCTFNYENVISMYNARKNHKLNEWVEFCEYLKNLPYIKEFFINNI